MSYRTTYVLSHGSNFWKRLDACLLDDWRESSSRICPSDSTALHAAYLLMMKLESLDLLRYFLTILVFVLGDGNTYHAAYMRHDKNWRV